MKEIQNNLAEKRKKRETYNKRSFANIRNSIQESLSKRAMTLSELAVDTKLHPQTAKRHILWLQQLGEVSNYSLKFQGQEKRLWKLNK